MAKLKICEAELGDISVPNKFFRKNGRLHEKKLKNFFKENLNLFEKILNPKERVFWLGREFGAPKAKHGIADFFGVDKAGFIVDVEVKVAREKIRGITNQIENHIRTYLRWISKGTFKGICEKYSEKKGTKYRMPGSDIIANPKFGSFDKAYRNFSRKGLRKPRGIKFFIIAPALIKELSKGFAQLGKKYSKPGFRVYFKWVLIDEPRRGEKTHYCAITTSSKI